MCLNYIYKQKCKAVPAKVFCVDCLKSVVEYCFIQNAMFKADSSSYYRKYRVNPAGSIQTNSARLLQILCPIFVY